MNLTELNQLIMQLNEHDRIAIIALIDAKTEADMTNIVQKLDALGDALKAQIAAMDTKLEARIASLEKISDERFNSLEKRLTFMQWCMLAGFSVLGLLITLSKIIT